MQGGAYLTAMASISHRAPLGRSFTATQERAGLEVKYLAYTSLKAAKSAISARKQVVLTTLSKPEPAASRMAHVPTAPLGLGGDALGHGAVGRIYRKLAGGDDKAVGLVGLGVGADGAGAFLVSTISMKESSYQFKMILFLL